MEVQLCQRVDLSRQHRAVSLYRGDQLVTGRGDPPAAAGRPHKQATLDGPFDCRARDRWAAKPQKLDRAGAKGVALGSDEAQRQGRHLGQESVAKLLSAEGLRGCHGVLESHGVIGPLHNINIF
jgi:hypothetical protein